MGSKLHLLAPLTTLAGGALILLPWIWLPLMMAAGAAVRRGPHEPRGWFLLCLAAGPILGFTLVSGWAKQKVLLHWAAPGYLMLFPLLGDRLDALSHRLPKVAARLAAATAVLVLASAVVLGTEEQYRWLPIQIEHFGSGRDPSIETRELDIRSCQAADSRPTASPEYYFLQRRGGSMPESSTTLWVDWCP